MGKIAFIHLSDIHFRKDSNSAGDIDKDLRESIIYDIKHNAIDSLENIQGLLIGGDIAFSGNADEYQEAQKFIAELVSILKIREYDVYCVPGNHDVNRSTIKELSTIYEDQCRIDEQTTIDDADKIYSNLIGRKKYPNLLYDPIEEYNEFAGKYQCDLSSEHPYWEKQFRVEDNFKICLRGLNSCLISNEDDNKYDDDFRPMYIGQSQIPSKNDDTLTIVLCHHPIECWKFKEELMSRMDKRADIQLYGHKHTQTMDFSNERLLLSAGAVHPVRGKDWIPRYNWLSIERKILNGDTIVEVTVYPRVLAEDRNGFIPEINDNVEETYKKYTINLTQKRREQDNFQKINYNMADKESICDKIEQSENLGVVDKRKLVYLFFGLSYPEQIKVLSELELIEDSDEGRKYRDIFGKILNKAEKQGVIQEFYKKIESIVRWNNG